MKLSHYTFERPIIFRENITNYLVVEDQKQLSKFLSELRSQTEGMQGMFTLSDGNVVLDIKKNMELIIDPFSIDPNSKTALNRLFTKMKDEAYGDKYKTTDELIQMIFSAVQALVNNQTMSATFEEQLDIVGLFKLLGVKFEYSSESILENICEYVRIERDYSNVRIFVFVNLRCFLSRTELYELYQFLFYNKISTLFIENSIFTANNCENIKIIDKDLCEIEISPQNSNTSTEFEV